MLKFPIPLQYIGTATVARIYEMCADRGGSFIVLVQPRWPMILSYSLV